MCAVELDMIPYLYAVIPIVIPTMNAAITNIGLSVTMWTSVYGMDDASHDIF